MNIQDAEISAELLRAIKETKKQIEIRSMTIAKAQADLVELGKRLGVMERDLESI